MPRFYQHWLKSDGTPDDPGSFSCDNCFMVKPSGLTRDLGPFKSELKCCTFHPFLPAFTLGALLSLKVVPTDVIVGYLAASRLTPLGAFPRQPGTSICDTGKDLAKACAFLSQDGLARCRIREYRPSTCAAYVCRSNLGASGLRSWQEWELKLKRFEWTLAHEASFELGRTFDDIDQEFRSIDEACEYYGRAYEVSLDLKACVDST